MTNYDFQSSVKNGSITLEGKCFKDCKISELKCTDITIRKCEFYNTIFSTVFSESTICFENCKFYGCTFDVTYNDCLLIYKNNDYKDCCFETISLQGYDEQSEMIQSYFQQCLFKNIKIEGDFTIQEITIEGGLIEQFTYQGTEIWANSFAKLKIVDAEIRAAVYNNKFHQVIFERAKFKGTNDDNIFKDCDMSGFSFEEQ